MENIGVVLKVTGASAFVTDINKSSTAVDKFYTTLAKGGSSFASLNSTMNAAGSVINNVAKSTVGLSAAQVTAALKASDAKNKQADLNSTLDKTAGSATTAASGVDRVGTAAKSTADKSKDASTKSGDLHSSFKKITDIGGSVIGKLGDIGTAAGGALVNGFKSAGSAVLDFAGTFTDTLGGLAGKAGDLAKDFIVSSVKVAGDFDSSMRVIQATSDISAKDLQTLTDYAIELGAKFPVSTKDVADGFGELTKAGFTYNQVLAAGQPLVTLAIAGNLSNAKSAEILAGTIRGFGLDASDAGHAVDILAQTANASSIDITDLEQTFKYAAPAAKALGFSLEDVSLVSGVLGNNFIKGSTAGTGLATIFGRMAAPPKEAAAAMEALGLKITDSAGKVRPLRDIVGELRTKFQGLSQVEQLDLAKKLAGQDAAKSLLSIVNTSTKDWDAMATAIDHAGGASDKMATVMSGGTKGAMDNLAGSIEAIQIKLGTALAPALLMIVGKLSEFANAASSAFTEIMLGINGKDYEQGGEHMTTPFIEFGKTLRQTVIPAVKQVADFFIGTVVPAAAKVGYVILTEVIPAVVSFATQAGTFLAPIIANVANFITTQLIPGVMKFAAQAAPVVISAVQNIGNFISTVLIPAVTTVVEFISTKLIPGFISFATTAAPIVQSAIQGIGDFFNTVLIPAFQFASDWISTNFMPVIFSMADTFTNVILPAVGRFGEFFSSTIVPQISSFVDFVVANVLPVLAQWYDFIATSLVPMVGQIAAVVVDVVIPVLSNWVGVIATVLTPVITALMNFISGTVIPVFSNVASFISSTLIPAFVTIGTFINTNVMPVLSALAGFLGGALAAAFNNITTVVQGAWNLITTAISTAWNIISGVFNTVKSVLSGDFAGAWTSLKTMIGQVWDGITNAISNAWQTFGKVFDNIAGALGGPFKAAWDAIKTAVETVWNGIVSAVQGGKNALDPIFNAIGSAIGAVQKVWDGLLEAVQKGAGVVAAVAKGDWSKAWDEISGGAKKGAQTSVDEINKIATTIGGKDFSAEGKKAGATISQGLAAGISGAAQGVVNAASNIASQAIAAAKSKLQSQSPSKVMIREGHNFTDGFKIGIDEGAQGVVDSVGTVIGNVVDEPGRQLTRFGEETDKFTQPLRDMRDEINNIIGSKQDPVQPLFILLETLWRVMDDAGNRMGEKTSAFVGKLTGISDGIKDATPKIKTSLTDLTGTMGKVIDDETPVIEEKLKDVPDAVDKTGTDINSVGNGPASAMTTVLSSINSAITAMTTSITQSLTSLLADIKTMLNSIIGTVAAAKAEAAKMPSTSSPPPADEHTPGGTGGAQPGDPAYNNPWYDGQVPGHAGGTTNAQGGLSKVAEEGAELIINPRGSMFMALTPAFVNLDAGSIVLDAAETREFIASGGGRAAAQATPGQIYSTINNSNRSTTNNYNLSLNNSMESSGVMADYDLMKMMV